MPRLAKVVNVLAIRQVKQGTETTGFRILALDLLFTESSVYLRDFSGIYKAQETDAFQSQGNIL